MRGSGVRIPSAAPGSSRADGPWGIREGHPAAFPAGSRERGFRKGFRVADDRSNNPREAAYKATGVDIAEADTGLNRIVERVQKTWPKHGMGRVVLPIGYYANVIEVDGVGMALCTDGVGSKTIIADLMRKYDTIGIDCVAMNVNDLICVGAKPLSLVDYIAIEKTDAAMLDAIGAGLCRGAEMAQISISGGEIAQLRDVINGFDLVAMALGRVDLDKIIDGSNIAPGDVVIGVKSTGLHSNGFSLARRALFEAGRFGIDHKFDELGTTLGEELLRPTSIYVRDAMEILEKIRGVKALFNITGDGLLNLSRAAAPVGYEIEEPIDPRPIGHAVPDPEKKVRIPGRNLVGRHKKFRKEDRAARRAG